MKTQIKQFDLYGKRNHKYDFLLNNNIKTINWNELNPTEPNHFFTNKNFDEIKDYEKGFKVDELFVKNVSGIETGRDNLFIDYSKNELVNKIKEVIENPLDISLKSKFNIKDTNDFRLESKLSISKFQNEKIVKIYYQPFDWRYIYYEPNLLRRNFYKVNYNIVNFDNLVLIAPRIAKGGFQHGCITKNICNRSAGDSNSGSGTYAFPLYLYPDQGEQGEIIEQHRTPNLNPEIVKQIEEVLGLKFVAQKPPSTTLRELNSSSLSENNPSSLSEVEVNTFAPIDLLDYIYAVLHSPAYREKYKEFLKIDFPRVPYPKIDTFWKLVEIGKQIREIHLLESPEVENYITKYPINGSNIVEKVTYKESKVYINSEQYFDGVPEVAWNFYIGGYQPAQKWLKDRKGRELNFDDIMHYQKIIIALSETDKLMKEIDKVGVE